MTIQEYIAKVSDRYQSGITTEHSFRGDLQNLLESLLPEVMVTNEPKHIACGAPDYILTRKEIPVGYIEAKDLGADINSKSYKEQFDRYRHSLNNLIITNYLDFDVYKDGEKVATYAIGERNGNTVVAKPEQFDAFKALIADFATQTGQTIKSSQKLAIMMANKAKMLAKVIEAALESDVENEANSTLKEQMKAFQDILIHDIKPNEFADIYAQTIAYGMFAARLHDPSLETFTRTEAAELIPKSNPFLRKLFQYIAGYDLDTRIVWIVDALADIFRATDVKALLKNFGKATQQQDPIIHFYETFLAEYDPKLRKARGVWYTPEPVVKFIVRAVDDILKTEFGLADGLADTSKVKIKVKAHSKATPDSRSKIKETEVEQEVHKVQILDPATGTATFLAEVVKYIYSSKFEGQQGIWSKYVEDHLIPRLNGFELLMASYAMAHLKLDMLLTETGYKPKTDQRLRIYLTNSLEEYHPDTGTLFASWLSSEANEANKIKRDTPVMVVIGNPPYSGESANKGKWIMRLMEDYKKEPGGKEKLKERNPKWINDDYVKFLRYGQHFIEKNGEGILAFINPHGFLDNPTFRGMRWHLLKTYDKIYSVDLHGNAKKKETSPDGSIDQNIFDIMQGVSINFFIKTGKKKENELGKMFHSDLYGTREVKYDFLLANTIKTVPYKEIKLEAPMYFMAQKTLETDNVYNTGFSLPELFKINSVGIVTARDNFTIHNKKNDLVSTITEFLELGDEEARSKFKLGKDVRDWQVNLARKDIIDSGFQASKITEVNYRPFDKRYTYYTGKSKGFHCYPRNEVMKHFINRNNIGIVFKRGDVEPLSAPLFISKGIIDFRSWSRAGMQGGDFISPLFLYPDDENELKLDHSKKVNLDSTIIKKISKAIGILFSEDESKSPKTYSPLDIIDYIYGLANGKKFRESYQEFLKIDFPRIPYPKDVDIFWQLVKLGGELRQIHLLESPVVNKYITTYPVDGDNVLGKPKYEDGKVWINDEQYFDKVPQIAWEFYIGGYQPAQKWLKDRKGRELTFDDILHYQKIIVALSETDRIMKEIDKVDFM